MKILITGGTGFVGRHLVAFWKGSRHTLSLIARHFDDSVFDESINTINVDITKEIAVRSAIIDTWPDVVIHTAAMSKPNDCEADKAACFTTNVLATQFIAEACKSVNAKLVFFSSDFVFSNKGPYSETNVPEPVNYYGETKRLAEEAIRASGASHIIVRTGLIVGPQLSGQAETFLHWVKNSLQRSKTIQLYTDQQRSPTYVSDLCRGIDLAIERDFSGTIHLSGSEVFSPYSLAQQVAALFGFNQQLLLPVTAAQRPEPARRPENAVLDISKAKRVLGYTTPVSQIIQAVFEP